MKWLKVVGLFLGTVVLLGGAWFLVQDWHSRQKGVSQSFAVQKAELVAKYPDFSKLLYLKTATESFPLPNLQKTQTLVSATTSAGIAQDMDPQGIVRADSYLLVSAYSRSHKYNSVIYVLDAKSGKLVKTVVLEGTPHVGGLAFDSVNKIIWVCSQSKTKKAQVAAITLETLKKYDFKQTNLPIKYEQTVDLGDLPEASFITYHDKALFIGFFSKKTDGILTKYDIQANGKFDQDYGQTIRLRSGNHLSMPEDSYPIDEKIQGITFYQGYILLSRSYGPKNSKIMVYSYKDSDIDLDQDAVKVIEAPPYSEQIFAYNDKLYLVFESAAAYYREKTDVVVDRILQLDLLKLFSNK